MVRVMANPSSIEHVQDAETKAKKLIEEAEKSKTDKIHRAREKASKIIEEAEAQTKKIKEDSTKKATGELSKERERKLSEAKNMVKKVQGKDLSKAAIKSVVDKLVKQILS